jgi:hypothetical protein
MWTFTFREQGLPISEATNRWKLLTMLLLERFPDLKAVRTFELHPGGHGLHVHMVVRGFYPHAVLQALALRAGFGPIVHFSRRRNKVLQERAGDYVAKYVGKQATDRAPELKGRRLWAKIGDWVATRVKDVFVDSAFTRAYHYCAGLIPGWGSLAWCSRSSMVHELLVADSLAEHSIFYDDVPGQEKGDQEFDRLVSPFRDRTWLWALNQASPVEG